MYAYSYAALVDDYEVVVIVYAQEPYERTGLVGYVDGLHAFSSTIVGGVGVKSGAFAISVL